MKPTRLITGEVRQFETPDWTALEELLGDDILCADFMWMHDVELEDGTILNAYKHRATRRYFHLAADGRAFGYEGRAYTENDAGAYFEIDAFDAIELVYTAWECCQLTDEERSALHTAISRTFTDLAA
jgi:hypothetical protein